MDMLDITEPSHTEEPINESDIPETATPILEALLDYAADKGLLPENTMTYRDLFDTKLMGVLMPRPSEVIERFNNIRKKHGIKEATNDFYALCQNSDYIRVSRIARNLKWNYDSPFGTLEITINLTKPEKDPKEIAALKSAPQSNYPKCALCPENVGYAGRINHPARQTLRTIPLILDGEKWHFQYSPYVYYNQHCIVLSEQHVPMQITGKTFRRLFDFIKLFPHYFIGSNADLPIVGGSILNHDHFQGGYHTFPMEKAPIELELINSQYPDVKAGIIHWPMSALRLSARDSASLEELAEYILNLWRKYSDPDADILAESINEKGEKVPHNTITPIARMNKKGLYELDLVFRNNRTSLEHPLGIFHPHAELHHIKKENIGLIEVMGLFILPGRLQKELKYIQEILTGTKKLDREELSNPAHPLHQHFHWIQELISVYGTEVEDQQAKAIIEKAVGEKCVKVLEHAGVFKATPEGRDAFKRFLKTAGFTPLI
jgi:UDPglucose--hexose-1-phosphate uridylyltransferase